MMKFQFSLRKLLLSTLAVSFLLWTARRTSWNDFQTIHQLRQKGVNIAVYDQEVQPSFLSWVVFGEYIGTREVDVSIANANPSDDDLKLLLRFPHIKSCDIYNSQSSHSILSVLESSPFLTKVKIQDSPLNSECFQSLGKMSQLESLKLIKSLDRGTDLSFLSSLKSLRDLTLSGQEFEDEHVVSLSGCTALRELQLINTRVTDNGLSPIKLLTDLRFLSLRGTKVNGEGLRILSDLHRIDKLCLADTSVNSDGLQNVLLIKDGPVLDLDVTGTSIKVEDVAEIRKKFFIFQIWPSEWSHLLNNVNKGGGK